MARPNGKVQSAYEGLLTDLGLFLTILSQAAAFAVAHWAFGPRPGVDEGAAIAVIWQVHAAFASIGFAGLAIAFQVLGDPPLTAGSARQSIVRDMRFGRLLVSGIVASLMIGVAALWVASPGSIAIAFALVLAPSVLLVGAAYARLAILFTSSPRVENLTLTELKQRVLRAAASAADQERAERHVEREIDAARGLVSGSLPINGDLKTRRIRNPHYGRVVSALNVGPMVRAADYLAWEAHQASTGTGFPTYDYPQRISVRARPNKQYRPGDTLFETHDWPGVDDAIWEAVSRQLLSGLEFTDDQSEDATVIFADEMSALQDSVLAAVRDHQIARVARGYQYYQQAIHEARSNAGSMHLGLRDPRWFERQIWEIDDAASRSTDRMAFVAIADAERMAFDAVKTEDLGWLRLALLRLQHIWDSLLEPQVSGATNARENLLVTMQNLAELAIPYSFSSEKQSAYASRQLIWAFAGIAKSAIDRRDVATAERVLGYMGGLFDLGLTSTSESLGVDVGVAQAAALGWMLFANDRAPEGSSFPVRLDQFPRRHRTPSFVAVLRAYETYRDEAPWRHWETENALPFRAHVLKFENYFQRAALLLLADGKLRLQSGSATWSDRFLLQATSEAVEDVIDQWVTNRQDPAPLHSAAGLLDEEVDRLDRERSAQVASTALSQDRLNQFHQAIVETMTSGPRLVTFLGVPQLEDAANADDSGTMGQILSGLPREFFVDSDVLASPADLGHQVAAAALRGQDFGVLKVLLGNHDVIELTADDLAARVREMATSFKDPVVIYNGQEDIEELLDLDFTDDGRLRLAGYEAFALFVGGGLPSGDLALVDREVLPEFTFLPEDAEGLTPLPSAQLAVGVREQDSEGGEPGSLTIEYGQVAYWCHRDTRATTVKVVTQEPPVPSV